MVEANDISESIREINLAYLLLAQRLIHHDKAIAIYRLGISEDLCNILGNFSLAQVIRFATSTKMLLDFRFSNDEAALKEITKVGIYSRLNPVQSSIVMAGMPVGDIE